MKKLYCLMVLALILGLVLAGCFIPPPIEFTVTSVTVSVDPPSFTGPCPKRFDFSAVITVNSPGTVTYEWLDNRGWISSPRSITFDAAGSQTVTFWRQYPSSVSDEWLCVHILTPNDILSNEAHYSLTCL